LDPCLAQINSQSIYEPGTGRFILAFLLRRVADCRLSVFDSKAYLLKLEAEAITGGSGLTKGNGDRLPPTAGRQEQQTEQ
jgi:hypothetical protein